jgi:Cysteinyl-tRNA synthetase
MKIFNTKSKSKECLVNEYSNRKIVKIFVCGPTVYDYLHLGHARLFIVIDTLVKYLNSCLATDTFLLVNVTDVDQKIDERARYEGIDARELALKYAKEMVRDLRLINSLDRIDAFAYVSDYIDYANSCIDALIEYGYAYRLVDRVYLDIFSAYNHGYGSLSCSSIDELMLKPLDIMKGKRNQADILLQYSSKGRMYPYWHMQDTAVALANAYNYYDIHIGSRDLLYPHHEAYIAQCKALTHGNHKARLFMHLGLLTVNGKKMSKSFNNVVRIRDIVARYGYEALRLYMLSEHYSKDMDLDTQRLERFKELSMLIDSRLMSSNKRIDCSSNYINMFSEYMSDDLATDKVIDMLYNHVNDMNINELRVISNVLL